MFFKQFISAVSKLDIVVKAVAFVATLMGFPEVAKFAKAVKVVAIRLFKAEQKELMRVEQLKDLVQGQLEQVKQQAVSVLRVATFPYASCLCPCLFSSFSLDHFLDHLLLSLLSLVNCLPRCNQMAHNLSRVQLANTDKSMLADHSTPNRHNSSHYSYRLCRRNIPSPNHPHLQHRHIDNHRHNNHRYHSCHHRSNHIKRDKSLVVDFANIGKQEQGVSDKRAKDSNNMGVITKLYEVGAQTELDVAEHVSKHKYELNLFFFGLEYYLVRQCYRFLLVEVLSKL